MVLRHLKWFLILQLTAAVLLLTGAICFFVRTVSLEGEYQGLLHVAALQQKLLKQFELQVYGIEVASDLLNPQLGRIETIMKSMNRTLDNVESALGVERDERRRGEAALWQSVQSQRRDHDEPARLGTVLLKARIHE